ncbi:hypothetical protein QJS83_13800 [Bdellovibrio sp. 22V]|uniref:hypothetical protein n=1 Tax=Bdellovibrio sp. 22V TaxID=3044166 RepID=UPI002542D9C2|nr:hypothetical protein [Bdellovibrio sp. 22V]WII71538.1 hypothetical protein QJS83_13800 [Bdellovibrio sp. 22V]
MVGTKRKIALHSVVMTALLAVASTASAQVSFTEVPQGLTVQGRIIQPDGLPLEDSSVSFNIKVLSPGPEACVLFEENRTVNMTNSKGMINFVIGANEAGATSVAVGHSLPLNKVLKNSGAITGLTKCASSYNSYAPQAGDSRKVRVSFTVGSETVALSPDFNLRSVPYSLEAENAVALEGKKAADFLMKSANITQEKLESLLLPANFDGLVSMLNPSTSAPATGTIGIPSSDGSATPARDGLMRYDETTQTVQVSVGGQWQDVTTANNSSVGSDKIVDGSITTADISNGAVTGGKIADNAITTTKLGDEAVTSDKLMNNSVTTSKIADGAITFNKIANGAISTNKIVDSAITSVKILDGTIVTADLANNAVTTAKILDANITTSKIADGNVTTDKIADANVTTAKIADSNVTTAKIADGNVTTAKIADSNVTTAKIADGNVTTAKIADNAVTTAKILDSNVTTSKIANLAVTTAKIADANVTTAKIADGNVTDAKIASVSGAKVTGNIPGNAAGFYGALSGDVTGGQSSTSVQRIQGRYVANVGPGVGQVLKWDGGQWVPQADNNSGGDITAVWAGTGLWGGGGAGDVSLSLSNTGVGAGWYGNGQYVPQFYVDAQGRITAVNNVAVAAGVSCGGYQHGQVYLASPSCGITSLYQCLNGGINNVGAVENVGCDGDGDGF